jgi:hypothetical protein
MGDLTNPIIYLPRKMLNDPVLDEIRIPLHSQQQQSHYATRGGAGRPPAASLAHPNGPILPGLSFLEAERQRREAIRMQQVEQRITQLIYMNELRAQRKPLYGNDAVRLFSFEKPTRDVHIFSQNPRHYFDVAQPLVDAVHTGEVRFSCRLPSPPFLLLPETSCENDFVMPCKPNRGARSFYFYCQGFKFVFLVLTRQHFVVARRVRARNSESIHVFYSEGSCSTHSSPLPAPRPFCQREPVTVCHTDPSAPDAQA